MQIKIQRYHFYLNVKLHWLDIPEFKKIVEKINLAKNIDILDNIQWDSNKCLGYCDFAIGKYTSLIGSLLLLANPLSCLTMIYFQQII